MSEEETTVIIRNGAVSEHKGEIVLRGSIDYRSILGDVLAVDDYQREQLSQPKIDGIIKGLKSHGVPDVTLGMRGLAMEISKDGTTFILKDPVFLIDGQQRSIAELQILQAMMRAGEDLDDAPQLGAKVYFGTTKDAERRMFIDLNLGQTAVSPNVIIFNSTYDYPVVDRLVKLTDNRAFVMYEKVCWQQNMRAVQLISGMTFLKVAGMLHKHAGPGQASNAPELMAGINKITDKNVPVTTLVGNVRTFYEALDKAYGINSIGTKQGATFLKAAFLLQLAKIFSDHVNFWEGERLERLVVDKLTIDRMSKLPLLDLHFQSLASGTGSTTAGKILYGTIKDDLNRGRKSRRLKLRPGADDTSMDEE